MRFWYLNIISAFITILEFFVFVASTSERIPKNPVHITQGYFTNHIPVHDFVYPLKISDDGKEASHLVTNYYTNHYSQMKKKREIKKETLHYDLPLSDGKTLKLVLTPNYDIATPSLVVEHKNIESEFNIGKTRIRRASSKRCYYHGKVVNDPDSDVAISTCRGLAGFIRSSEGDYFIEPSSVYDPIDGAVHPHIIFKKSRHEKNPADGVSFCGNKFNGYEMQKDECKNGNDFGELQDNDELHVNTVTQLSSFDDEKTNCNESSNINNNGNNNSSDDESEELDNNNEHIEQQIITTKNLFLVKQKGIKKLKGKLQKFDDKLYKDSDNNLSGSGTTEQYLEVKDDLRKKNNFYKLQNKQFLSKTNKLGFEVFDTNTDSVEDQSRKSDSNDNDDDSVSNNINSNSSNNDYDYNQDIDNTIKNSKKIKSAGVTSLDLNKSNFQTDKQYHHVHAIDESKSEASSSKEAYRKRKLGTHKSKKTPSKKVNRKLIRKHKHGKSKVFEVNTNDVANGLFDTIDKIKSNTKNYVSANDKLFSNKLFNDKYSYRNILLDNDYNPDLKNHSHQRKLKTEETLLMDDKKLNYNSVPQENGYFFDEIYDNSNSLLRLDSSNHYKDSNVRMNSKRDVEYKSCKLPLSCRNKTECVWEVRLLMVISYLFSQRHKDIDLETYVLTVINMINRNFHDSSLGVLVNIKLVRMVFIEYKMEELDEDKNKLEDLFENFCLFQFRINPYRNDHPNHHDIAVYIISTNICNINTLYGLSNQASVCDCQKSCIISIDEGLLLGNIISHQLGHSLGAEHNIKGMEQYCDPTGKKIYFHMDAFISMNATLWSKCSSNAIRKFLRLQGPKCLRHQSTELDFDWPMHMLPGQIYNPVQQCSLNFHMPLLPCYTGDFCKNLYCQINEKQCISNVVAPADGTVCASHMWCVRGYCVTEGRYPEMVNGDWNVWGPWSACSRTCGGGVQQANRLCNNPPPSRGGRYCIGKRTRYRVCSTERCDQHSMSFREQQCRKTEDSAFRGQYYSWKAFHNNFEYVECSLICESETGIIAVRRLITEDGTSCKPGTKNLCIAGKCAEVGCDWGINSGAVTDACGQCHGNGTECQVIQGLYTENNITGAIPFMKVPRGSGMIYVRELNPSDLMFVVTSFNTGRFYLNSFSNTERILKSDDVDFGNSRGLYGVFGGMERIFIPGPTDEDLVFFALFKKEKNPGIRYQFALQGVDPSYVPSYSWQFVDWETCSDACGGGQQKALPKCVEDKGGIVENIYCKELTRPENIVRSCNEFPCLPKWWVGSWSECITVRNEEVRYRSVLCMRTRDPNSLRNEVLKEKYCCDEEKPDSVRRCNDTYAKCQGKTDRCDVGEYEYFPSIFNFNDLNVRFAEIDKKNEDNKNHLLWDYSEPETGPSEKQKIDKISRVKEELDNYIFEESGKQTSEPLTFFQNSDNMDGIISKKSKDYVKLLDMDDYISPKNVSPLVSLKGSHKRRVPFKRLHEEDYHQRALNKNVNLSNPTFVGHIKMGRYGKIAGSAVENVLSHPRNAKAGSSSTQPNCSFVRLNPPTEATTCKVVYTCKTDDKNICNVTEPELPFKCQPPSPPLRAILDQIVLSEYKLAIIPTVCEKHLYRPGDHDYEMFHDTTVWAVGLEQNKTLLYGKEALNFLLSIRKNISRIPFVYQAET